MGAGLFPEIPFDPSTFVTTGTAVGVDYPNGLPWTLGDRFCDKRGRIFVLWKVDSDLTNDTTVTGEVGYLGAGGMWTQKVANGLDGTNPIFAGMSQGTIPESTSTTTVRNGLFLVKGRGTATITDGNVDAGDSLIVNQASAGAIIEYDETATNLVAAKSNASFFGVALAADVSTTSCDVYVASNLFG